MTMVTKADASELATTLRVGRAVFMRAIAGLLSVEGARKTANRASNP